MTEAEFAAATEQAEREGTMVPLGAAPPEQSRVDLARYTAMEKAIYVALAKGLDVRDMMNLARQFHAFLVGNEVEE